MTDQFTIKKATRQGSIPLVGLVGESGGGKSLTALYVARGFVGPNGKIGVCDTENNRALHFADMVTFDHLSLQPPFSPERYGQAIKQFEDAGYGACIVDSMTHEWNGEGGYLQMKQAMIEKMADGNWKEFDKFSPMAAAKCKPMHDKLVYQILRSKMLIILCFRGKHKLKITKGANGRTEFKTEERLSAIQESGIIFECMIGGEIYAKEQEVDGAQLRVGGYFRCQKHTIPSLAPIIPRENEQMGVKFGEQLAKWCAAPSAAKPVDRLKGLKRELWSLPHGCATPEALQQMAWDEGILMDTQFLESLTESELDATICKVKAKLERQAVGV